MRKDLEGHLNKEQLKILNDRTCYIVGFKGTKWLETRLVWWTERYRSKHNHSTNGPESFMAGQVKYVYKHINRLYKEMKRKNGDTKY